MVNFNRDLVDMLAASLAPVTVISGAALLLNAMTGRYGRTSDRIRSILREFEEEGGSTLVRNALIEETRILYGRARLIRTEITLVALGIFCTALCILFLSADIMYKIPMARAAQLFFVLSLVCIIVSLFFYLLDILASLRALKVLLRARPALYDACREEIFWRSLGGGRLLARRRPTDE